MEVNIPEKVRGWLYIFTVLGGVVMGYLGAVGVAGAPELSAWSAFTAAIALLARFNLATPPPKQE